MKTKILLTTTSLLLFASFTLPIVVSAQNLYGVTEYGGANNFGVIFQFNPSTSVYTKLYDFTGNGAYPQGSLLEASDGNLYGLTSQEGTSTGGILFQFNPSTSAYNPEHFFTGDNGYGPYGSLIQLSDGTLYGLTSSGGYNNNGQGVLFGFNPAILTVTLQFNFSRIQGAYPEGSLVKASDGNLYGMSEQGGCCGGGIPGAGDGTLFQFNPATSVFTKKIDFAGVEGTTGARSAGANPTGSLIQVNRNLYGMTAQGGANNLGILFQYNIFTSVYVTKFDFTQANGSLPDGSLVLALDGNLYGMTSLGGTNGDGVLFQFNPSTSIYTKMHDFTGADGANPAGSLMKASDGNLYGLTQKGGANNFGVIFQFNPSTSTYTKMHDFTGADGANPKFTNLIEVKPASALVPTLSQWALITLSVLVLGAGVVFVRGRVG